MRTDYGEQNLRERNLTFLVLLLALLNILKNYNLLEKMSWKDHIFGEKLPLPVQ